MEKSIKEYLPKKLILTLIQAKVPTEIIEQVKSVKEKNGWSWDEIITACLKKFLDDTQPKSK